MTHPKMIAENRWLEPIDTDARSYAEPPAPAVRGVLDAIRRHRLLMVSTIVLTFCFWAPFWPSNIPKKKVLL